MRLNSLDDLQQLGAELGNGHDTTQRTLVIPAGTCGRASGADELIHTVREALLRHEVADRIRVRVTGCHGFCEMEPSILVEPEGVFYPKLRASDAHRVVEAVAHGIVLEDLVWADPVTKDPIPLQQDIPFFKKQRRTILARNEQVNPEDVDSYLGSGGYSAFRKVLERGDPGWVIDEVKNSGLRGRGGAGFPTGLKWEILSKQPGAQGKYLVCNADEGDPGAYMDRSILEGNPHSILEGMLIGAYATGATQGIVYVRKEYPLAIKHLQIALEEARELGLLGKNILGTVFSFDIQVVQGAGAFVCGEETALIRSIEGFMGEPRQRPPFPIQRGIGGKPTCINNVETLANIPVIIAEGAALYAETGAKQNAGTKIFSLVGKIRNTGLVEVPMGMTINEIVHEIGGGPSGKAGIKAVQTGGPSGGCIPAARFDLPIDYDSLARAGSIMGSGGMIVMDEHTCVVDVAKYFMGFLKDESCGKCFTCRKGTQRMYEILEDVSEGKGSPDQLDLLEELALVVKDTTMCGLGQTAANPVMSTLRYFRDEYLEHIEHHRCPAGVCKALISYSINTNCTGCHACAKNCPVDAIYGEPKHHHFIDTVKCVKCGSCRSVCKKDAVEVL
jgi:NADH:ubiquinone oxidoreductase subunit F (NADH-binding)/(2Fe-2S) ferredoxin/NAD-dependent dihydropyrimidine dehydrogenase PreA subunit